MFAIDAHLDLSMNALEWNRDLTRTVGEINAREAGLRDKPGRGVSVVSLPELRRGEIGLVVATQIARYVSPGNALPGWHSPEQAWAQTQGQLAWYRAMEEAGEMKMIRDLPALDAHVSAWTSGTPPHAIGFILSLEGADSLLTPAHVERSYADGLRALGPAHYGPGRYAFGTDSDGPLSAAGRELLREMERLNIILDATHLSDACFNDALEVFRGHVWASHHNSRALVNHNRQFSDDQFRRLIERGAVIGFALDAWMMVPGWVRGVSTPAGMNCYLSTILEHIDRICSIAGNSSHVGIGSDLDGGFGREQCPADLETIADLQRVPSLLASRGYSATDISNIMSGNWLRFLRNAWA